jgi:protein gp37
MGKDSSIEWTHHTWNPWRGCEHVRIPEAGAEPPYLESELLPSGCDFCYAEAGSLRNPLVLGHWGHGSERTIGKEAYWSLPIKWDREAKAAGERRRVFSLSLGDWLEDREDLEEPRSRMAATILACPNLDFLLLTKRPQNCAHLASEAFGWDVARHGLPPNVWFGASVEHQAAADLRIPDLVAIPSAIHFLSVEPLLGPVLMLNTVDWVIVGGESGPHARPMHPEWVRSLRDQCQESRIPFFFKQWGEHLPYDHASQVHVVRDDVQSFRDMPCYRVGKKAAGRMLDGRTWDEVPEVNPCRI